MGMRAAKRTAMQSPSAKPALSGPACARAGLQGIPQSQGMRALICRALPYPGQPRPVMSARHAGPPSPVLFCPSDSRTTASRMTMPRRSRGQGLSPVQDKRQVSSSQESGHQSARPADLLTHALPPQMAGQPHLQGAEHTAARDAQHHARHEPQQQGAHRPGQLPSFFNSMAAATAAAGNSGTGKV